MIYNLTTSVNVWYGFFSPMQSMNFPVFWTVFFHFLIGRKKYSSLKVDSTCSDSDQSCHTCQYDEDCRGVYTSATWKKKFFRDEALNYDNSFNGRCMNGTCVACIEHDDCSDGYECCSGSECNNWKTNKVYGACHQAD